MCATTATDPPTWCSPAPTSPQSAAAGLNRRLLEAAITTALIGIDPRGRITVFNAGAVNLLGYDAQDTVGTTFVDLIDPDEPRAVRRHWRRRLRRAGVRHRAGGRPRAATGPGSVLTAAATPSR